MRNQHKPVLIFAQSGRFLAQSATQAGYRVWVADCFGDQETVSLSERWQTLAPLSELTSNDVLSYLSTLTRGEDCILICGSGIESSYSFLDKLPINIQYIGNSFKTISTLKVPQLFFDTLSKLQLPFPDTVFEKPNTSSTWLVKSASGSGGSHIQYLKNTEATSNHYFQQYTSGCSGSVLFLANGKQCQIISINKQLISANNNSPFRLGSIETPWLISSAHQDQLELAINKITAEVSLLGLNSLDFIISDKGKLILLEINPRPSASAELFNNKADLFQQHIDACNGLLPSISMVMPTEKRALHYIYASSDVVIPFEMNWPAECHDLPISGSHIYEGEPICTALIDVKENQFSNNLSIVIEQTIFSQLSPLFSSRLI